MENTCLFINHTDNVLMLRAKPVYNSSSVGFYITFIIKLMKYTYECWNIRALLILIVKGSKAILTFHNVIFASVCIIKKHYSSQIYYNLPHIQRTLKNI